MSKKFLSIHNHCSKSKLALAIQILMCCEAIAAPIGGEIVGGTGTITQQGSETAIIQDTERLAIDWQNFDVGKDERVTFVQPGQSAIALNRILSDKGSEILGQINANGHVILVNPQGVVFKEGAVVNAGGLIASGLQINPEDFMNGDLIFKHLEGTDGTVINAGTINAAAGGNVAMIGTRVENRGLISAHLSTVTLSSGKGAVLSFDDAGLLSVKVNEAMLQSELGDKAAVTNAGQIQAEGGRVLLSANTTRDVFSQAVNWGDRQQARSVTYNDDGSFTLGAGGDVVNSGDITVSGKTAGDVVVLGENVAHSGTIKANAIQGRGGNIELHANTTTKVIGDGRIFANAEQGGDIKLLGENVGLFDQAAIAATGEKGGGRVLLGGDQEGLNPQIRNAEFAYISENSNINASATDAGDGGVAIIFAEDTARIYGNLSAKGGATGGDGGFVETSGKRGFSIANTPDVSALKGNGGHWLIDPYSITIASDGSDIPDDGIFTSCEEGAYLSVEKIKKVLSDGINVTVQTGGDGGNITVSALIDPELTSDATLNLFSNGNIFINADITPASDVGGKLNLNLYANAGGAGGDIKFNVNKDGDPLFKDGDPLFLNNIKINTNGGEFVVGHLASEGNETPLIWKIDPMKSGASNVDFSRSTINTRSELGAGKFSVNVSGKVTLGDMPMFNYGEHYADLTIHANELIFYKGQAHLNGQNIQLGAAEWKVGDSDDLSNLTLETQGGDITLSMKGGDFYPPILKSARNITLSAVSGDGMTEGPEFEIKGHKDGITLNGILTLALGNRGSTEAIKITNDFTSDPTEKTANLIIASANDVQLDVSGEIVLGDSNVTGDLSLTSGGDIRQESEKSLSVAGTSTFNVSSGSVILNQKQNNFVKAVTVGGTNVLDVDLLSTSNLILGGGAAHALTAASHDGSISQVEALDVTGATTLSAAGTITLYHENEFTTINISKAESAEIHNEKNLTLGTIENVDQLTLNVSGDLGQSEALTLDKLILAVTGKTSLAKSGNRITEMSGSVADGELSSTGSLRIGDLTVENGQSFSLQLSGDEVQSSHLSQLADTTLTVNSDALISASNIALTENVKLGGTADLTFEQVVNFVLQGQVEGEDAADNAFTINGQKGSDNTYKVLKEAKWDGIAFEINGEGNSSLQGPNLIATWKINVADQQHTLSTKEQGEITFSGMTVLKGGEQDDTFEFYGNEESNINFSKIDGGGGENTLDYSKFNSDVNITVSRSAQYVDIISGIQVLVGNGDRATLQALDGIGSIWSISDDGESNFITWSPNEDADEPTELFGGEMVFRGFNNISGGPAADEFKVALPASVSSTTYMYTLDGGGGKDSLIIKDGGADWMGTYGVDQNSGPDQNSVPGFTFSFLGEKRIKVDYKEIENINLTAGLTEMMVWAKSPGDKIQLGDRWWQLNNFQAVDYTDGLQKLTVKGGGGSISLVRKENGAASPDGTDEPLPKENINFPNELEIVGGSLEFDENVSLNTGHLHLKGFNGGIGSDKAPLDISVDNLTLSLADDAKAVYLREKEGVSLAGLDGGGLVDLRVEVGDLSQTGAIKKENGALLLNAVKGSIWLEDDANKISVPVTLKAADNATLHASGDLLDAKVDAKHSILKADGDIEVVVATEGWFERGQEINIEDIDKISLYSGGSASVAGRGGVSIAEAGVSGHLTINSAVIYFGGITNAEILTIASVKDLGEDLNPGGLEGVTVLVTSPVVIQGVAEFNNAWVFGEELVYSASSNLFNARKFTPADLMIEIEELTEIDPAIFTNVRNYVYQDISIRLPSDQLYGEMMTE